MTEKRWIIRRYDLAAAERLAAALDCDPVIAALLVLRGVSDPEEAHRVLHPSLDQLHDPQLMLGMDRAVARLMSAIARGERILIYGDYDVDGTTGTALLRRTFQMLGAQTHYYIPHRLSEGYGINREALERACAEGYKLLLSVDCGISSHEPLSWASAQGMEAIVTDHHLPDLGRGVPPAVAVLNPNQPGCPYPDKNLTGVGVAFKLAHALLRANGRASEEMIRGFLKLVAIGTVADVAPLVGENRAIVALGLRDLPMAKNRGLRAHGGCRMLRGARYQGLRYRFSHRAAHQRCWENGCGAHGGPVVRIRRRLSSAQAGRRARRAQPRKAASAN